MELRGSVAVITGAARRLGAAIAIALARAGCDVVIHSRAPHAARGAASTAAARTAEVARAAGVRAITVAGDVTRAADVDHLLDATVAELGRADILIANAGRFRRTPIATLTEADWDDMLDNNLRNTFLCAHRFGLWMQAHGGGAIVTLADVAGVRPWRDYLPYCVAKAGVIALTQALAKELAPSVRVNAIAPGPVLFPDDLDPAVQEREVARTVLRRQGRPEHVAEAVVALLRNDYMTGVVLPVDGGRLLT